MRVHECLDASNRQGASLFVNWHNIQDPSAVAMHIEYSIVSAKHSAMAPYKHMHTLTYCYCLNNFNHNTPGVKK